jgi:hypothetical protein
MQSNRARTVGKHVGRAMAAFTALRQSCCHPQVSVLPGCPVPDLPAKYLFA